MGFDVFQKRAEGCSAGRIDEIRGAPKVLRTLPPGSWEAVFDFEEVGVADGFGRAAFDAMHHAAWCDGGRDDGDHMDMVGFRVDFDHLDSDRVAGGLGFPAEQGEDPGGEHAFSVFHAPYEVQGDERDRGASVSEIRVSLASVAPERDGVLGADIRKVDWMQHGDFAPRVGLAGSVQA